MDKEIIIEDILDKLSCLKKIVLFDAPEREWTDTEERLFYSLLNVQRIITECEYLYKTCQVLTDIDEITITICLYDLESMPSIQLFYDDETTFNDEITKIYSTLLQLRDIVQEEVNNKEIKSIADFLNVLKNEIKILDSDSTRFYRGLEKKEYLWTDYPSIYRSPNNNPKYEPYIKYEHRMFYDLVSRFPEQFSLCKNTFEHLVMMQHYEFPTRLLDITSNPLVSLYFACVDKYGHVHDIETKKEGDENVKYIDGAIAIYDVPQKLMKNYNSDTVAILSNLSRINEEYTPLHCECNRMLRNINKFNILYIFAFIEPFVKEVEYIINYYNKNAAIIYKSINNQKLENEESEKEFYKQYVIKESIDILIPAYIEELKKYIKPPEIYKKMVEMDEAERKKQFCTEQKNIISLFEKIMDRISSIKQFWGNNQPDLKFKHLIQEDKNYFIHENIIPEHLSTVFCVKPKLNNPRLISQNGAFFLFGFASLNKTKLEPPSQHMMLKAHKIGTNKKINIIIKGANKQAIVDELKQVGIHRASLFPEIDKVAQIVTSEYKIEKNDSPQTN